MTLRDAINETAAKLRESKQESAASKLSALNRLVRLDLLPRNPADRIRRAKEPVRTRAVLSKDECARLLDACDPHFRPLVLAALLTGQRPCELKALTWGDVSFGNRTITVFRTKVGLGDAIPMHEQLAGELEALKRSRAQSGPRIVPDDEAVFLSRRGRPLWDYRRAWQKAVERAGLDPSTGARPLRRTLQRHLQDTISEVLIRSDGADIEAFDADVEGGELVLRSRLRELEPSRT